MPDPSKMADMRVFEWLGSDSNGVPYYLHALNLVWSDDGVEHDLQVYRRVAGLLAADPIYWAELIRQTSWRDSLAGCACLLAVQRHDFYEEKQFQIGDLTGVIWLLISLRDLRPGS